MPFEQYDDFDETTWPDVGPLNTAFSGVAAIFSDGIEATEAYEDFTPDEGWLTVASFSDDPTKEGYEELEDWNDPSWGNDPIHPDVNLSFSPASFATGGAPNNYENFEFNHFGVDFPEYKGSNTGAKTSTLSSTVNINISGIGLNDVIVAGFALEQNNGWISSISQSGVTWSSVRLGSSGGYTRLAIWKGIVTSAFPGATATITFNSVSTRACYVFTKWEGLTGITTYSSDGNPFQGGFSKSSNDLIPSSQSLYIGVAATTSNVSWAAVNEWQLASNFYVSLFPLDIAMTYDRYTFNAARQSTSISNTPSANGTAIFAAFQVA